MSPQRVCRSTRRRSSGIAPLPIGRRECRRRSIPQCLRPEVKQLPALLLSQRLSVAPLRVRSKPGSASRSPTATPRCSPYGRRSPTRCQRSPRCQRASQPERGVGPSCQRESRRLPSVTPLCARLGPKRTLELSRLRPRWPGGHRLGCARRSFRPRCTPSQCHDPHPSRGSLSLRLAIGLCPWRRAPPACARTHRPPRQTASRHQTSDRGGLVGRRERASLSPKLRRRFQESSFALPPPGLPHRLCRIDSRPRSARRRRVCCRASTSAQCARPGAS